MFFTLEDPNAKIHGSRDPLGVQPVWSGFGRKVVTNLTTVTNSIRGFTVLIVSRLLTEEMIAKGISGEQDALSIFLRAEQISSYARYIGHDVGSDIRGIERVKRFVADYGPDVPIQDDATGMILSDQKMYGIWGLYTVSGRVSGLIADGPVGLTDFARDFADKHYWPSLQPSEHRLFKLLKEGGTLRTRKNDPIFRSISEILPEKLTPDEHWFYSETLRDARHVREYQAAKRQPLFAELLKKHTDLASYTNRAEVTHLAKAARKHDEALAKRLDKILRLEALLAPAEALFDYLQTCGGQTPAEVANKIRDHWGTFVPNLDEPFDDTLSEIVSISAVGADIGEVMARCDNALSVGAYEEAITALLDWNKLVMAGRNAAPWVQMASGKLDVRYRGQARGLPAGDALLELWRNPYFIDTLKTIALQLEENS